MADFSLFGGDTPDIGASVPSGGFNLFGGDTGGGLGLGSVSPGAYSLFGGTGQPAPALDTTMTQGPAPATGWLANLTGGLDKIMSPVAGVAKAVTPLAGLASSGLGIANAISGMSQGAQAQRQLGQASRTQREIAATQLPQAEALTAAGSNAMLGGPLPSGLQAMVDDYKKRSKAQIDQYLAHAGISDSTVAAQWNMYIEQQAALYGQQLAAGLYGQGLQGLGVAGGGASALTSAATALGGNVPPSIKGANDALARLTAAA